MSYFKPLRRKMGVVTMLLACVFLAGWARSLSGFDGVLINTGTGRILGLISIDQHLGCGVRETDPRGEPWFPRWHKSKFASFNQWIADIHPRSWQFRLAEFFVILIPQGDPAIVCFVPYWPVVIPLTLLSAYLLLGKPLQVTKVPL